MLKHLKKLNFLNFRQSSRALPIIPLLLLDPTVSQLKKLILRSINKPPWEGLKEEDMRY